MPYPPTGCVGMARTPYSPAGCVGMARMPYSPAGCVGMAGMPYPPIILTVYLLLFIVVDLPFFAFASNLYLKLRFR